MATSSVWSRSMPDADLTDGEAVRLEDFDDGAREGS